MNTRFFNTNKNARVGSRFQLNIVLALGIMALFLALSQGAFAQSQTCTFTPGVGFVCTATPPPGGGTPPPGGGGTTPPPVTPPGVNPATGFPFFFTDQNGVQLQLCDVGNGTAEVAPCPALALVDPLGGVVSGNIVEAFYYLAAAEIVVPNPNSTAANPLPDQVITMEALFEAAGAGAAAIVDNGYRFGGRGLAVAGTYTVTTPWGDTFDVTAAVAGGGDIRITDPPVVVTGFPPDFAAAAAGPVNPFLSNGTGPAGHLGDGITPAPLLPAAGVTAPLTFRVTGPAGSGFNNATTDQFTVQGKLFGSSGELTVDQATVVTGATPQVIVLASSNLPTPALTVSGPAGSPIPNEPIALTSFPPVAAGQPARFVGTFDLGAINPATQQLVINATAAGSPAFTKTVPIQDVVSITNASFDLTNNTLTINAASNFTGLAGVTGPTLTATDQNGNNLGTLAGGVLSVARPVSPSAVAVTSTEGGVTTAWVSFVGAAAPPPGGGGTTPPPGGGTTPPPTNPCTFVPGVGFVCQ